MTRYTITKNGHPIAHGIPERRARIMARIERMKFPKATIELLAEEMTPPPVFIHSRTPKSA